MIEDDFSRFIVGHVFAEAPTSEVVVSLLREAIRFHGKPERVYTDRAGAFTAWRAGDITACEVFLDSELIDHSLRGAHRSWVSSTLCAKLEIVSAAITCRTTA